MKATLVQTAPFVAEWKRHGLTDDNLRGLEFAVMERPTRGVVMAGTGGLRKVPVRAGRGTAKTSRYSSADKKILAGLKDGLELIEGRAAAGSLGAVRVVDLPDPPGAYDAERVLSLRERLAVSQIAFAGLLGVSLSLVQSWEQGRRLPNPMARRLMDEVARDPDRWARMACE